jgi:hypothetical protein
MLSDDEEANKKKQKAQQNKRIKTQRCACL